MTMPTSESQPTIISSSPIVPFLAFGDEQSVGQVESLSDPPPQWPHWEHASRWRALSLPQPAVSRYPLGNGPQIRLPVSIDDDLHRVWNVHERYLLVNGLFDVHSQSHRRAHDSPCHRHDGPFPHMGICAY